MNKIGLINSLSPELNSMYSFNTKLLNKTSASYPLEGQKGLQYLAMEKTKTFGDMFQEQFSPNHGTQNSEVNSNLKVVKEYIIPNKCYVSLA